MKVNYNEGIAIPVPLQREMIMNYSIVSTDPFDSCENNIVLWRNGFSEYDPSLGEIYYVKRLSKKLITYKMIQKN